MSLRYSAFSRWWRSKRRGCPPRRQRDGSPIPLTAQNRTHWDQLLIGRDVAALERAAALGGVTIP